MTENRGPGLLAVNIVFSVIAVCIVLLRCFTRAVIVKAFGLDDWLMILATTFFMGYIICSNIGVQHGTGQHKEDLPAESFQEAMKYWWFCYLFFSMCMVVSKLSFAWFLLRIVTKRLHAWIIYAAAMCTVIGGVAFFFVTLLQCQPLHHYWDKAGDGHCIDMNIIVALGYLYSVFSVITDFTFATLPGFVVWHLNLKVRARCMLIFLIAMGCVASSAVIVRFAYIKNFKDPDFLWATTDIAIWTTIEMGLAISAASLSTLRPLAKAIGWKLGLTSQHPSEQYNAGGRASVAMRRPEKQVKQDLNMNLVYVKSEVSQNAAELDGSRDWTLGTHVTAYAGHGKSLHSVQESELDSQSESVIGLERTQSDILAEEGKLTPKTFLK